MARQRDSSRCTSAGRLTARLLLSFLTLSSTTIATGSKSSASQNTENLIPVPGLGPIYVAPPERSSQEDIHQFTLRHIFHHGTYLDPNLHRRKDILNPKGDIWLLSDDGSKAKMLPLVARSRSTKIQRLVDRRPSVVEPMVAAAREQGDVWNLSPSAWTIDEIPGPNVTDKETVLSLAQMSANAYVEEPNTGDWRDVNQGFNSSLDFGWEGDGLRGHVFADETNSTIVIGLKGTSLAVFDGAETTTNDKENDNLFFSCCCAQQGQFTWRKVCDCATSTYTCNSTCVVKALRKENRYYQAVQHLYSNITAVYPDANVWVVGHSLGGAVSSLLGMTYGLPTVTFEAPGEALAASRLGLPVPPGVNPSAHQTRENTGTFHFGHTADPIFLGTCNGATGSCSYGGYAMETACHAGFECVYDVVADKGWRVGVGTHRINSVIDDVIKKYDSVPECIATPECTDCALWKYFESNSSISTTTTSTSTSKTRTRTETCKTPGWWGCLDESTTSGATTTREVTTTTSSTSSSTCKTPGWFGCYDKTTTTTSSESNTASETSSCTSTTSCHSPGFFGCNDPTPSSSPTTTCKTPGYWGCRDESTSTAAPITSPPTMPSSTSQSQPAPTQHKCKSRDWFGLICVDPSPTSTTNSVPAATEPPSHKEHCVRRSWLGLCKEWEDLGGEAVPEI